MTQLVAIKVEAYSTAFTPKETTEIGSALSKAVFYAIKSGMMNDDEKSHLIKTLEMMGNKPSVSPYKTDAERNTAYLADFAADVASSIRD